MCISADPEPPRKLPNPKPSRVGRKYLSSEKLTEFPSLIMEAGFWAGLVVLAFGTISETFGLEICCGMVVASSEMEAVFEECGDDASSF